MKQLNSYINEKLIIKKDSKLKNFISFSTFCHELYLHDSPLNHDDLEELYDLFKNDCDGIIEKEFDGNLISTNFELIFMCVVMLLDDDLDYTHLEQLGTTGYNGTNNPYDFSWFEEENKDGDTVLDTIQDLYNTPRYLSKFIDMFRRMYEIVEKTCTSYRHAIDGIWELQTKI